MKVCRQFVYFLNYEEIDFIIASKIYAIAPLNSLKNISAIQKLIPMERLLNIEELQKYKNEGSIDSKYLISVLCEPHFKEFMDEYLKKILVSG